MIKLGKLRHTITIQKPTRSDDAIGGQAITFVRFARVWAAVRPVDGHELEIAKQISSTVSHRIQIRYLDGVRPDFRVVWEGREFSIEAVLDSDERKLEMNLYCTEKIT